MRPAGEIRQQALAVAWEVAEKRRGTPVPGCTFHDLTARLVPKGVSVKAVRHTWKNLVRSGALGPVGKVRAPGVSRPVLACVPAVPMPAQPSPGAELHDLARAWVNGQLVR